MTDTDDTRDIFLSHTHADKFRYVRPLAYQLDERKISYWLDEAEIGWGDKISLSINRGLSESRYVVVFLSETFMGRQWPETELSAALNRENTEGRVVVLPIIIGDPNVVLRQAPLLRDKAYLTLDEQDYAGIADRLQDLVKPEEAVHMIRVPIKGTDHSVPCDLMRILRFLRSLDWNTLKFPEYIREDLALCGLLAEISSNGGIIMNGVEIYLKEPIGWGVPGIAPDHVVYELFRLCSGGDTPKTATFAGLGPNYRAMVSELASLYGVNFSYSYR